MVGGPDVEYQPVGAAEEASRVRKVMIDREKFEEYEKELVKEYIEKDEEAVSFFSNKEQSQSNRDRCVCAAFLRCLGVDFSTEELVLIPQKCSPGDVIFRDARFEVSEVLDKGRRRHDEVKERLKRSKQMKAPEDIPIFIRPGTRTPLAYDEVFKHVTERLAEKIARSPSRYTAPKLEKTDALVFVNPLNRYFNPNTSIPRRLSEN